MLTSRVTKQITHPSEAGVEATIRKLSHHQLMMAADARMDSLGTKAAKFAGVTFPEPSPEEKAQQKRDGEKPENKYDRLSVLRSGITSWTYDVPVEGGVEDLDELTAEWLFGEIIAFSLRSADEVKASASDSPPTTGQDEGAGLPS